MWLLVWRRVESANHVQGSTHFHIHDIRLFLDCSLLLAEKSALVLELLKAESCSDLALVRLAQMASSVLHNQSVLQVAFICYW